MNPRFCAAGLVVLALSAVPLRAAAADDSTSSTVTVTAQFGARSSLMVSASVLHFVVVQPGQPAVVVVEFSAAARTRQGGEVLLTVEPMETAGTPMDLSVAGDGDVPHALATGGPCVAGRWTGSGRRSGRLTFVLQNSAAGSHSLPVQFVLSTP
jgi:hypothetical protein